MCAAKAGLSGHDRTGAGCQAKKGNERNPEETNQGVAPNDVIGGLPNTQLPSNNGKQGHMNLLGLTTAGCDVPTTHPG